MKVLSILLTALCFILVDSVSAQDTGSFQKSIAFDEPDYKFNRTLYYFVPEDYDENEQYKLVVGLRGGPHTNAGQFRDQLTFLADSLNAIIMCPENIAHFNSQEGLLKQLFAYSLDTTMSMYNIDPDFIYLTGLSFGGRHAVIVSMDTDDGAIPKLRGVIPFATGSNGHIPPNYEAIDEFAPACICIGNNDAQVFKNVADDLFADITSNGGKALLNKIPNVGHTVAFATYPDEMMKCLNWIEANQGVSNVIENSSLSTIEINPNPVSNMLKWTTKTHKITNLSVVNMNGQVLKSVANPGPELNVSDIPSGTYFLLLTGDQGVVKKQFIKQ